MCCDDELFKTDAACKAGQKALSGWRIDVALFASRTNEARASVFAHDVRHLHG